MIDFAPPSVEVTVDAGPRYRPLPLLLLLCAAWGPGCERAGGGDADGDGYTVEQGDCDDTDDTVHPDSHHVETPGDGVDTDCDGLDACTDLNCDGYPDVVISNSSDGSTREVESAIYFGGPEGPQADHVQTLPTWGAMNNSAADLDADGYVDLVFSNYGEGGEETESWIYWGGADGFSEDDRTGLPTRGAYGNTVADVDGDGWLDILFSNNGDPDVYDIDSYLYWGSEEGFSESHRTGLLTSGAWGNAVGDLDGDGWNDVVFANACQADSHNFYSCIYWGAEGGFDPSDYTEVYTIRPVDVSVYDLDGDGHMDLVQSANHDGDDTYDIDSLVYWGSEQGPTEGDYTALPTLGAHDNTVADVNGDGHPDIVFANFTDGETHQVESFVYLGGSSGFSEEDRLEVPSMGAWSSAVGDLDGDSHPELVITNHTDGISWSLHATVFRGQQGGISTEDPISLPTQGATDVSIVGGG